MIYGRGCVTGTLRGLRYQSSCLLKTIFFRVATPDKREKIDSSSHESLLARRDILIGLIERENKVICHVDDQFACQQVCSRGM